MSRTSSSSASSSGMVCSRFSPASSPSGQGGAGMTGRFGLVLSQSRMSCLRRPLNHSGTRCEHSASWRYGRGSKRGGDSPNARCRRQAGRSALHAGDARLLWAAVPGQGASSQGLRHDRLAAVSAHGERRSSRGSAVRRLGARGMPGRLPSLLEGGLAPPGRAGGGRSARVGHDQ